MGCLTIRWRKRSPAADQARYMGTHAQKDASSEKSTLDQSQSTFSVAHAKRFSMWTSESRGFCIVGRYCTFASANLRLILTGRCSCLSVPWQVIDGFCVPLRLYPHLHEVLRLFKHFGNSWVWKMWSACMGAQKNRFVAFSVDSTHSLMLCNIWHFEQDWNESMVAP